MTIGSCRGEENKRRIVREYDLEPIQHAKLLEGQKIKGCCGFVTDRYYRFNATSKADGKVTKFVVGYDCAEQLLELVKIDRLPLFNPLSAIGGNRDAGNGMATNHGSHAGARARMAPINAELHDAIQLLCIAWMTYPQSALETMLKRLFNDPANAVTANEVVHFNHIVGMDKKGRTLTAMLQTLRLKNPTLRSFTFPLMEIALTQRNQLSHL